MTARLMRLAPLLYMPVLFLLLSFSADEAQAWWMWTPGDHVDNSTQSIFVKGYHPVQPIAFSHELHAGKRQMNCEYCHNGARRSRAAGIPPLNTCMGCHKIVRTESEEIKKLKDHYDKNIPLKWVKVHDLPDYVRFTHKPHVNAKFDDGRPMLKCQDCHGAVEKMTTAEQFAPLQMGWCLECHNRVKTPATATTNAKTFAPVSCNTCHY